MVVGLVGFFWLKTVFLLVLVRVYTCFCQGFKNCDLFNLAMFGLKVTPKKDLKTHLENNAIKPYSRAIKTGCNYT